MEKRGEKEGEGEGKSRNGEERERRRKQGGQRKTDGGRKEHKIEMLEK